MININALSFAANVAKTVKKNLQGIVSDIKAPAEDVNKVMSQASHSTLKSSVVSDDTKVDNNHSNASFFANINLNSAAEIKNNEFFASVSRSVDVEQSDFNANKNSIANLDNIKIKESKFENNTISAASLSKFEVFRADFTNNNISRANLYNITITASRLTGMTIALSNLQNCVFDQSDIQGLSILACNFYGVTFKNINIAKGNDQKIIGKSIKNIVISNCNSVEEILDFLEKNSKSEEK